jgi:hypothetical protein
MAYRRAWSKRRPGYYEKPSAIRYKRRLLRELNAQRCADGPSSTLKFYTRWEALWDPVKVQQAIAEYLSFEVYSWVAGRGEP